MVKSRLSSIGLWLIVIASMICPAGLVGKDISAKASLDSVSMIMGSKSPLRVEFVGNLDKNAYTYFNSDDWKNVEISETDSVELKDLGNGRSQLRAMFMVQAFDSGLYSLPPIYLIAGKDTIETESLVLKVDPVDLDSANVVFEGENPVDVVVHDYTDVSDDESRLWDFVPDWVTAYWLWILIIAAVLALLVYVYMKWLRHGRIPLIPVKKPVPPYVLAVEKLNDLQQKKLWQKGAEKEYYTQLTDILRGYLGGRFGINAMEMTTPQILSAIDGNEEAAKFAEYVSGVLREADFVKFAKAKPEAAENERAFSDVREFVELTKPVENPDDAKKETSPDDSEKSELKDKTDKAE